MTGRPSRSTVTLAVEPGTSCAMRASSIGVFAVARPSTSTTTSSTLIPARSAGPPRCTLRMITPSTRSSASAFAAPSSTSWGSTPSQPRVTSPFSMICARTSLASVTGMAKPMPCEPPERE